MRYLLALTISVIVANMQAQSFDNGTSTYAVVIGISDYQDAGIPDLRYADRDAEAFANYLRSPGGGSLDSDHLKVLTNENATLGQVATALDGLVEQAKEDDKVIIYFSGHGDVEGKKISQPGYLLCWDALSHLYTGSGAYSLHFLQEIVTTLSQQNLAKVIVIMDACHAGKLAGSSANGSQLTATNLAKQFVNEVKMLSCQPNELSLEGEQWGGGRGIFSYFLVDGLVGLADYNGDGFVSLYELDRYLSDNVMAEAAPQTQIPMIIGNKTTQIASVDEGLLAALKRNRSEGLTKFLPIDSRGLEEQVLAQADTVARRQYLALKQALLEKRFFEPEGNCAEGYYTALASNAALAQLHGAMRRNYAAALQDDAQQVLNNWLSTDLSELVLSKKTKLEKYAHYPRQLERAAELLGPRHYLYPSLQARKLFFRAYLMVLADKNLPQEPSKVALATFKEALHWQADLPQVYWQMSNLWGFNLKQPDSAEHYAKLAMELRPNWSLPYSSLAYLLARKYKLYEKATTYLEAAQRLDSNPVLTWSNWGNLHFYEGKYEAAVKDYLKVVELDSNYIFGHYNLANAYYRLEHWHDAENYLRKTIELDPTFANAHHRLGNVCLQLKRYGEAEQLFKNAIELDASYRDAYFNLACTQSVLGKVDDAFATLGQALENGEDDYEGLQQEQDLAPMRERKEQWETLMKKYFPDRAKD